MLVSIELLQKNLSADQKEYDSTLSSLVSIENGKMSVEHCLNNKEDKEMLDKDVEIMTIQF